MGKIDEDPNVHGCALGIFLILTGLVLFEFDHPVIGCALMIIGAIFVLTYVFGDTNS